MHEKLVFQTPGIKINSHKIIVWSSVSAGVGRVHKMNDLQRLLISPNLLNTLKDIRYVHMNYPRVKDS